MFQFDAAAMVPLALHSLDEAFAGAQLASGRSWGTRLALACLAHGAPDRQPFDLFWQALAIEQDVTRRAMLLSAMNSINRLHGRGRFEKG